MIIWHRFLGLTLTDTSDGTPLELEMEVDVALKRQFLDIVIMRKGADARALPVLPEGLEDPAEHTLITYKSQHQTLSVWSIMELLSHMVSYRKQVSPSPHNLLPEEQFRMVAISTRIPRKLQSRVELEKKRPGVYDLVWRPLVIQVLVLSEMPATPRNAIWMMFSGDAAKAEAGLRDYRPRTPDIKPVIGTLLQHYGIRRTGMSYTMKDFRRENLRKGLQELTVDERLAGLSPDDRLRGLSPDEVLRRFSPDEVLRSFSPDEVLRRFSPDEMLSRLSPEQIEAYLRRQGRSQDKTQQE